MLCYLLSHVNAIGAAYPKLALLRTVKDVSDQVKAQVLLPTIQGLVGENSDLVSRFGPMAEDFLTLVVSCLDGSVSSDLNEASSLLWPVFVHAVQYCFLLGMYCGPYISQVDE